MNPSSNRPIIIIFSSIGLVLLAVAALLCYLEISFGKRAMKAEGVVIALEARRGSKGGTLYAPVVEFDANWQKVRFTSSTASSPAGYDVGDKVEVLYEPNDPNTAAINSFFSRYLGVLVCGFIGLIFGAVGAGLIFAKPKK